MGDGRAYRTQPTPWPDKCHCVCEFYGFVHRDAVLGRCFASLPCFPEIESHCLPNPECPDCEGTGSRKAVVDRETQ